jgi:2-polyprenyl-3-methyl-5-hydroxy-6-metoxy-1,4-benzoquinol methylase
MPLEERTIGGLHDFLLERVLSHYARRGNCAVDLGAGSGALAVRLRELGVDVVAVDMDARGFKGDVPFIRADLDDPDFTRQLGEKGFDLVTSVEFIEHLESPVRFLRNVRRLLKPGGMPLLRHRTWTTFLPG